VVSLHFVRSESGAMRICDWREAMRARELARLIVRPRGRE